MATHFQHYRSGTLYGMRYRFDASGDAIPAHTHDATTAHNVCVLRGSVEIRFQNETRRLRTGDVFDFDGTRLHGIVATEPAEILNLFLNGIPPGYDTLPAYELEGTL